jgi:NAD(P)H-hydrate repair Nnr-like enzyme with NAD(P)H-hydrate epimerase domain
MSNNQPTKTDCMPKVTTAAQMRDIDAAVINKYRIPGLVLMEHAAAARQFTAAHEGR